MSKQKNWVRVFSQGLRRKQGGNFQRQRGACKRRSGKIARVGLGGHMYKCGHGKGGKELYMGNGLCLRCDAAAENCTRQQLQEFTTQRQGNMPKTGKTGKEHAIQRGTQLLKCWHTQLAQERFPVGAIYKTLHGRRKRAGRQREVVQVGSQSRAPAEKVTNDIAALHGAHATTKLADVVADGLHSGSAKKVTLIFTIF